MKNLFLILFCIFSINFTWGNDCNAYRTQAKFYFDECAYYIDLHPTMGISPEILTDGDYSRLRCYSTKNEYGFAIRYESQGSWKANCTLTQPPLPNIVSKGCFSAGSIVERSNQIVGEKISIPETSFDLVYYSNRVIGRKEDYTTRIPITLDFIAPTVSSYNIEIKDENGNVLDSATYPPLPNITHTHQWTGFAFSSNNIWGKSKRIVTIIENATDTNFPPISRTLYLGGLKALKLGTGAWLPSVWHFYDSSSHTLFKGDGSYQNVVGVMENGFTRVADESGKEIYYFDSVGKIIETKTGITGTKIFGFNYDASERLISITQPFNKVTTFSRNSSGVLQSINAPTGAVTNITINSNGYLSKLVTPSAEEFRMTYYGTSGGLLHTFTKPDNTYSSMTYDTFGNLITDLNSNGTGLSLAKVNNKVTTTSSENIKYINDYNKMQSSETNINPSGLIEYITKNSSVSRYNNELTYVNTTFRSDLRFGNQVRALASKEENDFGLRNTVYTQAVSLNNPIDPFSINTLTDTREVGASFYTHQYTGDIRSSLVTSKLGRTVTTGIDQYERLYNKRLGNLTAISFTYTDNLLTRIQQSPSRRIDLTYYPNGLIKTLKNPLNEITTFAFDSANRLSSQTMPDLRQINFSYDSNENLTSILPPSRPLHQFTYGSNGKIELYSPPLLTAGQQVATSYSYNLDKKVTKIIKPDGVELLFNYDATTGLLKTISGVFGTITKNYYRDLVSSITNQYGVTLNSSYTGRTVSANNLTIDSQPIYNYSRSPNLNAGQKVASETINGSNIDSVSQTINYNYDDDEYLTSAGSLVLNYNSPNGQLTGTVLDTITDQYTYNAFGEITYYAVKIGNVDLYSYTLTRDNLGRIKTKVESLNGMAKTFEYFYDSSGRLIKVNNNGFLASIYQYDNNNNRISGNIRSETTAATYDNQDRLINYNGIIHNYNVNGELLTKGSTNFEYDVFGNLKSYGNGLALINYEIDPSNRRLGRLVNGTLNARYIYSPEGRLIGELDNTNKLIKTFIYGSKAHVPDYYIDSSNNRFRIISDSLGSVRVVISSSGVVSQIMEHDEYGRVLQDSNPGGTPFGYAGGIYDPASNLVRFGVRDYDPQTGRWLSKDPIGFKGGDTNLYSYVQQDPINYIDVTGEFAEPMTGFLDFLDKVRNAFKFRKKLEEFQDKALCKLNENLCEGGRKPDQNPIPKEDPLEENKPNNQCTL